MKVSSFAFPATAAIAATIGLNFLGIIPPFKEITTTHHDQSAVDNTNNDGVHQEERSITKEAGIKPEASLFLPGSAPAAALNDNQRRFHMYTINRKLESSSCEDSPLKVLIKKNIKSAKTCAFISKKPNQRCKGRMVKSHCPNACGVCESFGTSDSEATFLFKGAKTTCAWLHDLVTPSTLTELSYWCQLDSLRATCRETCGFFCANEPKESNVPSSAPSTLPSSSISPSSSPTTLPSSSPTKCSNKITSVIDNQFGDVVKGPPQEQAIAWLLEDMANNECDNEAVIMQRYILAVLYFSAGGDDWVHDEGCVGWLESGSECDWEEVICNDNHQVTDLFLGDNNLHGTIPAELSSLSNLESLQLSRNKLSGSIPGSIFQLPKLERLLLESNGLTGKILDNFGGSSSLEYIFLYDNLLTGTIPDVTGDSLQSIEWLSLGHNKLSGYIPGRIFELPKLEHLDLYYNGLTGKIPDNFGGSSSLKSIWLDRNLLTGTIPDVTGDSLQSIEWLSLHSNKLSGSIPGSIFALPKLEHLSLSGNDLTGKIPDNFGGSSSLKDIALHDNLLTGTIPDVTGNSLQNIEWLILHSNKMSGPVPEGICALRSSKPNQFYHLAADCAPPDNAQNPCPSDCCTKCFEGKGLP